MARCILVIPKGRVCLHWRNVRKLVCTRIKQWRNGNTLQLWAEAPEEERGTHCLKRQKKESSVLLCATNAHQVRQAMQDGQYKKAIQALTSSGLAQVLEEVYHEMLAKHRQYSKKEIA